MSLKDNFYQAVKELLNHGGLVGSDLEEQAKTKSDLDSYLETPEPVEEAGTEIPPYQNPYTSAPPQQENPPQASMQAEAPPSYTPPQYDPFAPDGVETPPPQPSASRQEPPPAYGGTTTEMTIISKNTLVEGNIRSFANITVEGSIKGDVDVLKDARLSGKLVGGLKCNNAAMQGSAVQGDVLSKGRVQIDSDALVLGDLSAQYADVNGKVKGDMEVSGKVEFKADAVVLGDIHTSSIVVLDGANIRGFVDTKFLRENADTVFPTQVSISGEEQAAPGEE